MDLTVIFVIEDAPDVEWSRLVATLPRVGEVVVHDEKVYDVVNVVWSDSRRNEKGLLIMTPVVFLRPR